MRILIDGVFFQLNNTGITYLWRSLLEHLVQKSDIEIFLLNRGGAPTIAGVTYIPFPSYHATLPTTADDSVLIQKVCDFYEIDVFSSTYYTTPLNTPMLLLVYDMIPELLEFDLSARAWMEKELAISYAQHYICISENTKKDLIQFYPTIPDDRVDVAHCGVDKRTYRKFGNSEIEAFTQTFGLNKPYFLFVGSRSQHNNYKNSKLFFDAIQELQDTEFDILCVGGEKDIEESILKSLPKGVNCLRVDLTEQELSIAYNGAIALIYPSLYEGFGMPVIEAMASNCPVITTQRGSLPEAAGDAACFVDGTDVSEMSACLEKVMDSSYRETLQQKGVKQAAKFDWDIMSTAFYNGVNSVVAEAKQFDDFRNNWQELRRLQASVDV